MDAGRYFYSYQFLKSTTTGCHQIRAQEFRTTSARQSMGPEKKKKGNDEIEGRFEMSRSMQCWAAAGEGKIKLLKGQSSVGLSNEICCDFAIHFNLIRFQWVAMED